ncbi:hypothetical protein A8F94_00725 [Bacillus sp. FJAT-27225]|uniref:hypothetical protein n=1 Tax=Bacillus sp. FJAT-27225 TaxID=1743144 RepID=UPI00080C2937|nr:hypothetical protein [Bacillus sp. FJAT-27225]OCA90448.1 hypothetical protein A8F94_00725 [Bacillus sp. FJAT-27225]
MKRFRVLMLTVVFLLTMALPAMAQGTKSGATTQKVSYSHASFYGGTENTDTYVSIYSENKDAYILYYETYNFDTNEYQYASTEIPASEVVFNTTKGTVAVNKAVDVYKFVEKYDRKTKSWTYTEVYVGKQSVNLTWSFNSKSYSTYSFTERNVEIDYEEYLKLYKGTNKEYRNVLATGTVAGVSVESFQYSGGSVSSGTGFAIIK